MAEAPTGEAPHTGDGPKELSLRPLERKILLSAVLILAGITAGWAAGIARFAMIPGAACGAAIAYGNFFLLRKILEKALTGGAVKKGFIVQYVLKFVGLVAVVFLVVRYAGLDVLGFLFGLSALFLGILAEALAHSFR